MPEILVTAPKGKDSISMIQEAMRLGICDFGSQDPQTGVITLDVDDKTDLDRVHSELENVGFKLVKERKVLRWLISLVCRGKTK